MHDEWEAYTKKLSKADAEQNRGVCVCVCVCVVCVCVCARAMHTAMILDAYIAV
jgi:hypothetical protein